MTKLLFEKLRIVDQNIFDDLDDSFFLSQENHAKVSNDFLEYLEKNQDKNEISYSWGFEYDKFGNIIEGASSIYTDGIWVWTFRYFHNLKIENAPIPISFSLYVQSQKYKPKKVSINGKHVLFCRYMKAIHLLDRTTFQLVESNYLDLPFQVVHSTFNKTEFHHSEYKISEIKPDQILSFFNFHSFKSYQDAISYSIGYILKNKNNDCWILNHNKLMDYYVNEPHLNKVFATNIFKSFFSSFIPKRLKNI